MILGVEPKIKIPKPLGGRITVVLVRSSLTIEEQYKKAGLIGVAANREKPRNSMGFIAKLSDDPFILENFKIGDMVWFAPLVGQDISFMGFTFRTLDFNDIINKAPEEDAPEDLKTQARQFLQGDFPDREV